MTRLALNVVIGGMGSVVCLFALWEWLNYKARRHKPAPIERRHLHEYNDKILPPRGW